MALPTACTCVWASSGSWRWTGRPGVLQAMGSHGDGHDLATELTDWNWHCPHETLTPILLPPHKATQTRKSGKATKIQVFLMAKPLSFPRHAAGGVEATAVGYHWLPPAAHSPLLEDCPDWRIWRITTAQQHFSQLVFWLGSGLEFCNTSMLWMETFRLLWKMCLCLAS